MWRLAMTVSSYDEELVVVSMFEEGVDTETSFLATTVACSSSRS
jgi:hypothetical protein